MIELYKKELKKLYKNKRLLPLIILYNVMGVLVTMINLIVITLLCIGPMMLYNKEICDGWVFFLYVFSVILMHPCFYVHGYLLNRICEKLTDIENRYEK